MAWLTREQVIQKYGYDPEDPKFKKGIQKADQFESTEPVYDANEKPQEFSEEGLPIVDSPDPVGAVKEGINWIREKLGIKEGQPLDQRIIEEFAKVAAKAVTPPETKSLEPIMTTPEGSTFERPAEEAFRGAQKLVRRGMEAISSNELAAEAGTLAGTIPIGLLYQIFAKPISRGAELYKDATTGKIALRDENGNINPDVLEGMFDAAGVAVTGNIVNPVPRAAGEMVVGSGPIRGGRVPEGVPNRELNRVDLDGYGQRPALTQGEKFASERAAMGMAPEEARSTAQQILDTTSREAPLTGLAREIGVEPEIRQIISLQASETAQTNSFNRLMKTGELPDGTRMLAPMVFFEKAAAMEQVDRDAFSNGIIAMNVRSQRQKMLANLGDELVKATQLGKTKEANRLRLEIMQMVNDAERSRGAMTHVSNEGIEKAINDMQLNPKARELANDYMRINSNLTRFMHRNWLLTDEKAAEFLQRPWHSTIFEARGNMLDSTIARDAQGVGAPEITMDPFASLRMQSYRAVEAKLINDAKHEIYYTLSAGDRYNKHVRRLGRVDLIKGELPLGGKGMVYALEHGHEVAYQYASPAVADAVMMHQLDMSSLMNVGYHARKLYQSGTTGNIANMLTLGAPALKSLGYDVVAGYVAKPVGRSYGYIDMLARKYFGNDPVTSKVIDVVSALDPTQVAMLAPWLIKAPVYRAWGEMGAKIMRDMARSNSFLYKLGQDPNMKQFLDGLGAWMYRQYNMSSIGLAERLNAITPHAMLRDTLGARNKYEAIAAEMSNAGRPTGSLWTEISRSPAGDTARVLYRAWSGAFDAIYNANKYAYFWQNLALLEHKYGAQRYIPEKELFKLAEETRNLGGDLHAQPNTTDKSTLNQVVRGAFTSVPYFQIMANSTRYVLRQLTTQGTWQGANVALRIGSLGTVMYLVNKTMEWIDEANGTKDADNSAKNWYYEKLNQFERSGILYVPKETVLKEWYEKGKPPQFDPMKWQDYFYKVTLPQEIAPFVETVRAGFEGMGLINRGRNLGKTNTADDLKFSMGNVVSINLPLVSAAGALAGYNLQLGGGRAPVSPVHAPKGQGANTGNLPSGIPVNAAEAFKAITGAAGRIAVDAADAAGQSFAIDGNVAKAAQRAFEEVVKDFKPREANVRELWQGADKFYQKSAMGDRISQVKQALETVNKQWSMEFSPNGAMYPNSPLLANPEVAELVYITHHLLSRGPILQYQKVITMTNAELETLNASKGNKPPAEIEKERRQLLVRLREEQQTLLEMISEYDDVLSDYKEIFDKHNQPPTIEGVVNLSKKYLTARPN